MHVDAILVVCMLVFKVVSETERRRKFASGLWVEVDIGAARVDCVVSDTKIGDPGRIVSTRRQISRQVGHEIINAKVSAQ
jgi:hypothetical protein